MQDHPRDLTFLGDTPSADHATPLSVLLVKLELAIVLKLGIAEPLKLCAAAPLKLAVLLLLTLLAGSAAMLPTTGEAGWSSRM